MSCDIRQIISRGQRILQSFFWPQQKTQSLSRLANEVFNGEDALEQSVQKRKIRQAFPPDILLSGPYKELIDRSTHSKHVTALSIIWLLSIAKEEEHEWIPEIIKQAVKENPPFRTCQQITTRALIEKRLGCKIGDHEESTKKVLVEAYTQLSSFGFHGTHFAHYDSIQEKGLCVERKKSPLHAYPSFY